MKSIGVIMFINTVSTTETYQTCVRSRCHYRTNAAESTTQDIWRKQKFDDDDDDDVDDDRNEEEVTLRAYGAVSGTEMIQARTR
jgi:hypothetical protein